MRIRFFPLLLALSLAACKNDNNNKSVAPEGSSAQTTQTAEQAPAPLTDPKLEEMRNEGKKRLDKINALMTAIDALPASARLDRDLQLMRNALDNGIGKAQSAYQDLLNATKEDKTDASGTVINSSKAAQDALEALERFDPFLNEIQAKIESLKK